LVAHENRRLQYHLDATKTRSVLHHHIPYLLLPYITILSFHSRLKTHLFHIAFPP